MKTLPQLWLIGPHVVGVVSECHCPGIPRPLAEGVTFVPDREHEGHDIVPPRMEQDMPEGVDFEDYTRWCQMFAAAPDMLAALETARLELARLGMWGTVEMYIDPAIAKAKGQ